MNIRHLFFASLSLNVILAGFLVATFLEGGKPAPLIQAGILSTPELRIQPTQPPVQMALSLAEGAQQPSDRFADDRSQPRADRPNPATLPSAPPVPHSRPDQENRASLPMVHGTSSRAGQPRPYSPQVQMSEPVSEASLGGPSSTFSVGGSGTPSIPSLSVNAPESALAPAALVPNNPAIPITTEQQIVEWEKHQK